MKYLSFPYISFPLAVACLVAGAVSLAAPRAAHAQNGLWISSCNYSHSRNDDPIVFPAMVGASHLHDFVGSRTTDAFSTAASLRAGSTTCAMPDNASAYWVPATYEAGVQLTPSATHRNALFYYSRGGGLDNNVTVQPMPSGLKMLLGNMHATSPAENPAIGRGDIFWRCGTHGSHLTAPPSSCPGETTMVLFFQFPQCWDGVHLDSPDHLSHMADPHGGVCPASHPVPLPQLKAYWRYNVGSTIGTITYSSGAYYTAHMDVFSAWDQAAMQALVTRCINANTNCGGDPAIP